MNPLLNWSQWFYLIFFSFPFYNRHISWICFGVRDMYDFYMGVQIFYFVHRCILKNTKIQLYVYWIDISLCQSPNRVNICEVSSWNFVSLLMSFILKKKKSFWWPLDLCRSCETWVLYFCCLYKEGFLSYSVSINTVSN